VRIAEVGNGVQPSPEHRGFLDHAFAATPRSNTAARALGYLEVFIGQDDTRRHANDLVGGDRAASIQ
jgi:hypothetical protein